MEDFLWITNPKRLKEFRLRFNVYDHQRNGIIKVRDLLTVLKEMGQKITKYQIEEMMREAALDDYDDIHYDEFLLMVSQKEAQEEVPEEVYDAFMAFDNGKGFIEADDMRKILTTLGNKMIPEEVDEMLKEAKVKDGKIKITDFVETICQ